MSEKQNFRLQFVIAFLGLLLLFGKLLAYNLTGSNAILTDALESIVNVVAGFVGLYSLAVSAKPRDYDHPYGHGKIEFLSSGLEGFLIMSAGVGMAIKAIHALFYPPELGRLEWGLVLIGLTAIANWLAGYYCIVQGNRTHSPALLASGHHLQSDTYSTAGVIVGLLLVYITGQKPLDSIVAFCLGIMIVSIGFKIIRRSVAGIMDEADHELMKAMIVHLSKSRSQNWIDIHNLRIIKYGGVLHIDCHLTLPWYFNVREAHEEVDAVSLLMDEYFPNDLEVFIHTDPCLPESCRICNKSNCHARLHTFEKQMVWELENVLRNAKHHIGEQ